MSRHGRVPPLLPNGEPTRDIAEVNSLLRDSLTCSKAALALQVLKNLVAEHDSGLAWSHSAGDSMIRSRRRISNKHPPVKTTELLFSEFFQKAMAAHGCIRK